MQGTSTVMESGPEEAAWSEAEIYRQAIGLLDEIQMADSIGRETSVQQRICRLAAEITGAGGASLFIADSSGVGLISVAVWDGSQHVIPGRRLGIGEGVAGAAFRSDRTELHSHSNPHPAFISFADDEVIESLAACPIRAAAVRPLGVLCVVNAIDRNGFDGDALGRLRILAEALGPVYRTIALAADLFESNRALRASVDRTARLYSIAFKIGDRRPIRELFEEIAQAFRLLFGYQHCGFFLGDQTRMELVYAEELPFPFVEGYTIGPSQPPPDDASGAVIHHALCEMLLKRCEVFGAIESRRRPRGPISCAAVPFESGSRLVGAMLLVRNWEEIRPINSEELERCRVFVAQCALSIDQALAIEERERVYESALRTIIDAIEIRQREGASAAEASGHSARVVEHALLISDLLGLPADERRRIELGCLLHDIGKIEVPEGLLMKPGALSASEFEAVKRHVTVGTEMVMRIGFLREVAPIVRHHHERWDGSGYPDRLAGESIPLGARIVAIADAYEVMTGSRVYSNPLESGRALEILKEESGKQFDPRLVELFCGQIERTRDIGP